MSASPSRLMDLRRHALAIRRQFVSMHYHAKAGHCGTGLSAIDLLAYLYAEALKPEDSFILSKGHGASSLYATLHHFGRLTDEEIATYYKDGTRFPAHPAANAVPAIVAATGSLGHGLSIAAGMAYAKKLVTPSHSKVYALLSDGECNEGSVWEAIAFAAHHKLDNLVAIVDANGLQGFGATRDVLNMEPMTDRWSVFGFDVRETDGHDFAAIDGAIAAPSDGRPVCVIARTSKGQGVRLMEDKMEWHYLTMSEPQYLQALADLDEEAKRLEQGQ